MKDLILTTFKNMASYGTAPENGVIHFSAGNEEVFARIDRVYLSERFSRGVSDQKFVVGPFGSGKTHFINHLMELARERNCVTSKVTLNKEIDYTKTLVIYQEVVRGLTMNNQTYGLNWLFQEVIARKRKALQGDFDDFHLNQWINGLDQYQYKLNEYGRLIKRAFLAIYAENNIEFESIIRWLSGEIGNKQLARDLGLSPVSSNEQNRYAQRMLHSLFQFIKFSGFQGTVVAFDEAEQGFQMERKKVDKIHSLLMSQLNSLVELQNGSVLMVYALTPDMIEKMRNFAALQQRLSDPGPGMSFFDGNTYAPVIDLTHRDDPYQDLLNIAYRLSQLFLSYFSEEVRISQKEIDSMIERIVTDEIDNDYSSSNRRQLVKRTCSYLLSLIPERKIELDSSNDIEEEV